MKFSIAAASLLVAAPVALAAPSGSILGGPGSILNFGGRVNIAVRQVQAKYPHAVLYECQADPDQAGSRVTDPETQLSKIHCVFSLRDGTQASATIDSTGWGEFGNIVTNPSPWLEDQVIDVPADLRVSLGDAYKTCRAAPNGCPASGISSVTLRKPLYPGMDEPYYIFNTKIGHTFVGTVSGKVKADSK